MFPVELDEFFELYFSADTVHFIRSTYTGVTIKRSVNYLVKRKRSRNRFQEIKRYLHLADNDNLAKNDKLAKVRPYLNLMQGNFAQFGLFSKRLSVDEQMVPYYGHFSTKMYMKNKPVKFEMKIWFLASSQGYPFQVYAGKSD